MSWQHTTLRNVAEIDLGRQRSPEHANGPNMVPYLRAANVMDGSLKLNDVLSMNFSPKEQPLYSLRYGDVLVTEGSGSLGSVGASAVYRSELEGTVCFQNTLLRVRPRADIDGRFLGWWTRSAFESGLFAAIATGANIYHISAERVRMLDISVPTLQEQLRIADFLDAETTRIDNLVSALDRKLGLLVERRSTGVAYHVVNGDASERRRSTLPWVTTIPTHWEEPRLGLVAHMGSGHTPSRSKPEWWVDCTIPWVTTGEVRQLREDRLEDLVDTREKISELGMANSAAELHPKGTVFLCRTASAGYSGVMGTDMATSQDFVTWTCGPRLNPYYLLWCLRAMRPDLLGRLATGSTHLTIYVPDLQMLRIPLPSVEEQQKLVDRIRRQNRQIDSMVDKVRRQVELMKERRQALITAAVTGQIDVSTASGRGIEE
ncbi:type I restriction enzyme, S subunit [Actinopolyspora mzabensis]|uniref:Type I restriction enzyme, S subunit n=1 Tax=Actinopolyspora mzabensis TaxID=995066 RepID=A0A1G9A163_ACTMZ|nr:restriction endonuclease subunit S [Actinopolyspora mzabensis]SDK20130.1 type I restriction enzyme, S subunit [Actinopolyspora mzabensis]